jgi:hypothetical protein
MQHRVERLDEELLFFVVHLHVVAGLLRLGFRV